MSDLRARNGGFSSGFGSKSQVSRGFAALSELLHCLSLLPAQSHKSMELIGTTKQAMTELLEQLLSQHAEELERRGEDGKGWKSHLNMLKSM